MSQLKDMSSLKARISDLLFQKNPKAVAVSPTKYFRSIVILGSLHNAPDKAIFNARNLELWIERFDTFQRQQLGLDRAENLFLAIGRTISFFGDSPLSAVKEHHTLFALAKKLGYATSVRIAVSDALGHIQAYRDLVSPSSAIMTVMLDSQGASCVRPSDTLNSLVLRVLETGKSISLIGPPAYWLDSGILALPRINGATFNLCGVSVQDECENFPVLMDPCASRFQVYISETGEIFPCQGLVGVKTERIGHILERSGEMFGTADWSLLEKWARIGPAFSDSPPTTSLSALPVVCRRHREQFGSARELA